MKRIIFFVAITFVLGLSVTLFNSQASQLTETHVQIEMDGLMLLSTVNTPTIGILNAPDHTPTISIFKNNKQMAQFPSDSLKDSTSIYVENEKSPQVSYLHDHSESDFDWTLDLEKDLFQRNLYLKQGFAFGKIVINTGQFFARNLTEEAVIFRSGSKQLPFNRRIGEPAINITLQPGQALVVKNSNKAISLPYEENARYTIKITNLPPPSHASMDHFLFYYGTMGVEVERYEPVMVKKVSLAFPRPFLCSTLVVSTSSIN